MTEALTPEQRKLAEFMSELSELCYCAGWMEGLEYALWHAVETGPFHYGRFTLQTEHVEKLRLLSGAAGGWIRFDEVAGESFVPLAEWIEHMGRSDIGCSLSDAGSVAVHAGTKDSPGYPPAVAK